MLRIKFIMRRMNIRREKLRTPSRGSVGVSRRWRRKTLPTPGIAGRLWFRRQLARKRARNKAWGGGPLVYYSALNIHQGSKKKRRNQDGRPGDIRMPFFEERRGLLSIGLGPLPPYGLASKQTTGEKQRNWRGEAESISSWKAEGEKRESFLGEVRGRFFTATPYRGSRANLRSSFWNYVGERGGNRLRGNP